MGFGYPKDARDGLIESDPDTFFLPPTATCATSGSAPTWSGSSRSRCGSWSPTPGGCARRRCCTTFPSSSRRPRPHGQRSTPASGTTYGACCTPTCTSPIATWCCAGARRARPPAQPPHPKPPAAEWPGPTYVLHGNLVLVAHASEPDSPGHRNEGTRYQAVWVSWQCHQGRCKFRLTACNPASDRKPKQRRSRRRRHPHCRYCTFSCRGGTVSGAGGTGPALGFKRGVTISSQPLQVSDGGVVNPKSSRHCSKSVKKQL